MLRLAALVDEHHAAVEITLLASETFIDLVGNDVGDAPPVFRRGEVLLASQLLARGDIPQPELGLEATVTLPRHATGDQRLRVDALPVRKLRRRIDVGNLLDESCLIDRRKQAAALEVIGDDLRHAVADLAVRWRAWHEIRNRNRKRRDVTLRHLQAGLCPRQRRQQKASGNTSAADQRVPTCQRHCRRKR